MQRFSTKGAFLNPIVQEPSGIVCLIGYDNAKNRTGIIALVAFPNGNMNIKATDLPEDCKHEHAVEICAVASEGLKQERANGAMVDMNGIKTVSYKNGYVRFKADVLPQGQELDYAVYMLESATAKMQQDIVGQRMNLIDSYVKMQDAVPSIAAVTE